MSAWCALESLVVNSPSSSQSGKSMRKQIPRESHADWSPSADRASPVDVITNQNSDRLPWLVPIRHQRMAESPFAFYRGAAKLMALDLSTTPTTGIHAQICGDAHLSNFGFYGSPDRRQVFDINDFDETLPGPWEWDVKRLAGSFAICARHNDFDAENEVNLAVASVTAYREAMRRLGDMRVLDVWYARVESGDVLGRFRDDLSKEERKSFRRWLKKARSKDSLHALGKLAEEVDGRHQIISQPPFVIPLRDLASEADPDELNSAIRDSFSAYLESLPHHMKVLLRRFRFTDFAVKVVGVGSVGTRCFMVLLEGRSPDDPLFLQIKEATRSVLEDYLPTSTYSDAGQRVVEGQRLMQTATDSFLGWGQTDASPHHYYWRQLKDMRALPT